MPKNTPKTLVIVESPTKARTLERYLGGGYAVRASYGHIRDLPKSKLGVDTERGFEPEYVVPEDSERAVRELRAAFRRAGDLVLATDFDREGEAIAYHVAEVLGVPPEEAHRVTFTEITRDAILEAFRNPRAIDLRLVEAQQARRILDRLVGYRISPLLWKKVRRGLSAGRVQSVALRLIVDREREIRAFQPREYWSIDARLSADGDDRPFLARLVEVGGAKVAASPDRRGLLLRTEEEAMPHVERLRLASYRVTGVREREVKRGPAPPFTTSTLQQEAARKLGFSSRRTMAVAQQLYEGVDLPGEGRVGLITYMRTDSVHVAEEALRELAQVVRELFGPAYALPRPRRFRTKQRAAQEAHEAIRPTSARRLPERVEAALERDQARLYRLIWQRAVASQMAEARFDQVAVDVAARAEDGTGYLLRATGQALRFDGFRRVYLEGRDEPSEEDRETLLPRLVAGQALRLLEVLPEQHFTQPPPRYSEASLVKALEELGIGRPSTYASIISTLQERGYVRLEDRRFLPEDVGEVVTDLLVEFFPEIVDVNFTARMEEELDDIAEGKLRWVQVLDEFYGPFERLLEKAEYEIERFEDRLDERCPQCPGEGREPGHLVVKLGRYGKFIGCERWPECTYRRNLGGESRPEPAALEEACPECGRPLVRRVGRYGPFVGCSGYPECRYVKREDRGTGVACPRCGEGQLVRRRARRGGRGSVFYGCSRYPECDFTVGQRPVPVPCPDCGSLMVARRDGSARCTACGAVVAGAVGGPGEAAAGAEAAPGVAEGP